LGPRELALRLLALDELAHLASDGIEHAEKVFVGLTDLVTEELHHTQESAGTDDGEPEGAMQSAADRVGRPREVLIARDVGNPRRVASGPDPPRQADAGREDGAVGHLREFL